MERQHTENLFRRYKGRSITVNSISGNVYQGLVGEITNDYVLLNDGQTQVFVVYEAIESIVVSEAPT